MHKFTIILLLLVSFVLTGCAVLDKIVPPQYDDAGEIVPGSREPTEVTKAVADTVPYGNVALNFLLLAVAGVEHFRSKNRQKGLVATMRAIKEIKDDPEMEEMWEKLRNSLISAQENSGTRNLIKILLSKV